MAIRPASPSTVAAVAIRQMQHNKLDGTISLTGAELPTRGYYVGGVVPSLVDPLNVFQVADFIESADAEYVGIWTDTDTGTVYVDLSDWTPSESNALAMGRERGEIAIWDIEGCREIRCERSQRELNETQLPG